MRPFYSTKSTMLLALVALSVGNCANATGTLFRSYLSINGNDSNACTVTAPCRLLPAALAQTQSGGEVWILDSANYNTGAVAISQSVTILAVPGALGSLVANNANAINVSAASVVLTLRNLVFRNLAGTGNYGVFASGGGDQLIVERSEFSGLEEALYVSAGGGYASVSNSVFRNNAYSVDVEGAGSSTLATGVVEHCTIVGSAPGDGPVGAFFSYAKVTLDNTNIFNTYIGIQADAGSTVLLNKNVITKNSTGIFINGGSAQSTGKNTLDNSSNVSSGTITTVSQY